ncbi:MAG: hypothetical protein ABW321_05975 [Polyangiales bacterium]
MTKAQIHEASRTLRLAAAVTALAVPAAAGVQAQEIEPPAEGYELVWNDEFDGDELNRANWCTRLVHGGGSPLQIDDPECTGPGGQYGTGDFLKDERQKYRDVNRLDEPLHVVEDGALTLRATKTRTDDEWHMFESALIRSKFEFKPVGDETYYIVSRLRLPTQLGSFAAQWLSAGFGDNGEYSWPPEIDTLEAALNGQEDNERMVRVGAYVAETQTESGSEEFTQVGENFDTTWNNLHYPTTLRGVWVDVEAVWTANDVCTYINGELAQCENYFWVDNDAEPANPAHIIFNLAVGGEWAGRHGIDDGPMTYDIDYVRIFKK